MDIRAQTHASLAGAWAIPPRRGAERSQACFREPLLDLDTKSIGDEIIPGLVTSR